MSVKNLSKSIILFALISFMGLASCCGSKNATIAKTVPATEISVAINSTKWKLTEMNGKADKAFAEGNSFTIEFIKDKGTIAGAAACNRYFGSFELKDNGYLKIKTGGSTMMACPNMELEQPYFAMLESVTKYSIKGETLSLYNGDKKVATYVVYKADTHKAQ